MSQRTYNRNRSRGKGPKSFGVGMQKPVGRPASSTSASTPALDAATAVASAPSAGNGRVQAATQEMLKRGGGRLSQANNLTPYSQGGFSVIPRRNIASPTLLTNGNVLQRFATNSPLRLLTMLADIDADVALALDIIDSLINSPGDVAIVAVRPEDAGQEEAEPDPVATAALNMLSAKLPPDVGGQAGLQTQGTLLTLFTGLNALEAVPGARGEGLIDICPTDSLTLGFLRDNVTGRGVAYQRQIGTIPQSEQNLLLPGFRRMNPERFFWNPFQTWPDDPFGRAHFGPALIEVLVCLSLRKDILDSSHHTAHPRGVVGFNFTETYKIATAIMGFKDKPNNPEATNWVLAQLKEFQDYVAGLKPDDWIVQDSNTTSQIMAGGSIAGIDALLERLELRLARALKMLPVMMGYTGTSSTETHTTVQWQVMAKRLEKLRSFILQPILAAYSLHLRLLGMPFVAVARYEKMRTTDAFLDAQTEQIKIKNVAGKMFLGAITFNQGCMELTGTKAAQGTAEPSREDLKVLLGVKSQPSAPAGGPDSTSGNDPGSTQEENDSGSGGQGGAPGK